MSDLDALSTLCERLEELAALSDELRAAVERDDGARIRELTERSQALSDAVAEANQATLTIDPSAAPPEIIAQMQSASARVRAGSDALGSWLARAAGAAAVGGPAPGGAIASLPEGWNFDRDVAVAVGDTSGTLARELASAGQKRLLVFLTEDGGAGTELPERALVVRSDEELAEALANLPGNLPVHGVALRAAGADRSVHEQVGKRLRLTLESLASVRQTAELLGEKWVLQGAANLPEVASWPSIDRLRGAFEGKPCVIVSPGPSLDKNVHLLPAIKDRALVVTSSHALHALDRAGVVADLVLALDPQDLRYHFEGCAVQKLGAVLLGVTVHPELYRMPARRIFTFAANSILERWVYDCLGDDANLPPVGSVACSALALALRWKCDPIILVGQDLAFEGERYYSRLSVDESLRVSPAAPGMATVTGHTGGLADMLAARGGSSPPIRILEAPGYYGGTVPTCFIFQMFRHFMEAMARSSPAGTRLLNCTEGGSWIEGFDHVPLAAALDQHVKDDLDLESALDRALAGTDRLDRRRRMRERVRELLAALDRCVSLARNCSRVARQARRNPGRLRQLGDAEKKLTSALKPVLFVSLLAQARINQAYERGKSATDLQKSLDASLELYDVVSRAGEVLRPVLATSLADLEQSTTAGA